MPMWIAWRPWQQYQRSEHDRAHNALTASRASLSKSREKTGIADYRRRPLSTVQLPSFIEYVKENSEYRCGRTYPHIQVRSAYPSQASNRDERPQLRWQREGRQEQLRHRANRPLQHYPPTL